MSGTLETVCAIPYLLLFWIIMPTAPFWGPPVLLIAVLMLWGRLQRRPIGFSDGGSQK